MRSIWSKNSPGAVLRSILVAVRRRFAQPHFVAQDAAPVARHREADSAALALFRASGDVLPLFVEHSRAGMSCHCPLNGTPLPPTCGSKKKSLSSCWRSGRPGSLGATSAAVAAPASCPNLSAPALLVDPPPQLLSRGGREREGHLRRGDVNEQPAVRSVGGSAILSGA